MEKLHFLCSEIEVYPRKTQYINNNTLTVNKAPKLVLQFSECHCDVFIFNFKNIQQLIQKMFNCFYYQP